jgi:hypothetical protein
MKKTVIALCFLTCASICWGQMQKDDSMSAPAITLVDNTAYAKTHNVWHLGKFTVGVPASTYYDTQSIGADGYQLVIDSGGRVSAFSDYPVNNYTLQSAMGVYIYSVAVGSQSFICGLGPSTSTNIYCWNGSSWVAKIGWGTQLSATLDQTLFLCGTDTPHTGWKSTDSGASWTQIGGISNCVQVIGADSTTAVWLKNDGTVYFWNGTSSTPITGLLAARISTSGLRSPLWASKADGTVWQNVWNGSLWAGWFQVAGTGVTQIHTGGAMNTWVVGATQSGANVWRFPDTGIQVTETYTTHTICPGGCPPATHTPKLTFKFAGTHHSGGGTIQGSGAPPATYNQVSMTDTLTDPFFCDENGAECVVDTSSVGITTCNILGQFSSIPVNSSSPAFTYRTDVLTKGKRIGIIAGQGNGVPAMYNVSSMCNPQTGIIWQPGQLWLRKKHDNDPDPAYLWGQAWCVQFNITNGPWRCQEVFSYPTTNTGYENCTTQ